MKIKEIRNICKKYSEAVFRMALSHMVAVGSDRLRNINVEEAVKEILASDNPKAFITPQMQASILRCACELAQQDLWDILAFVQTDISIHGVVIHPGVIVGFYEGMGDKKYCTYVLPADTSEDLIEDVAEAIRNTRPAHCNNAQLAELVRSEFRKKSIRVKDIEEDLDIGL